MRMLAITLSFLLAACGGGEEQQAPAATPAALTFDGGDAPALVSKVAHGKRLADVLGCTSCHGPKLQGERFYELYASNLTRDIRNYSDAQFERLMRGGQHPTGREVWGMPSEIFQHLTEADLAAVLAYLRSLPPAGPPTQPRLPWEEEAKALIAAGKLMPAADLVEREKAIAPVDLGESHALGRYMARVTCAECHGGDLKGRPGDTPDLITAGAYSAEEFERLLTVGVAPGGRKLKPMMEGVAKDRFSHLTRQERDALYAYLKARAERAQ